MFLIDWVIKPNIGQINIESYLNDNEAMETAAIWFLKEVGEFWKVI